MYRQAATFLLVIANCTSVLCTPGITNDESILTEAQWAQVDRSVERGLRWLASKQQSDGSFPTLPGGQPGVTSLCVMAFMAHGHLPGEGPYGRQLELAIDNIASRQRSNGLIALIAPRGQRISRNVRAEIGTVVAYNHAISSLVLSESFSVSELSDTTKLKATIERALQASLEMQRWGKSRTDQGGWRYLNRHGSYDSDLSLTGWELMFLRSAKNAGFEVPQQPIDDAIAYVRRCFNPEYGTFEYEVSPRDRRSRAMAGAGVLALAHAGYHDSTEAKTSGEWILRHKFDRYNETELFSRENNKKDRYHYGVFNCSQAMYQLGGHYWEGFFPSAATALVNGQQTDGSWPAEGHFEERKYGNAYTTALSLLALGAPNQLLPIFQR